MINIPGAQSKEKEAHKTKLLSRQGAGKNPERGVKGLSKKAGVGREAGPHQGV